MYVSNTEIKKLKNYETSILLWEMAGSQCMWYIEFFRGNSEARVQGVPDIIVL